MLRRDPGYVAWQARASVVTQGMLAGTVRLTIPHDGGFTFAERPEAEAPGARIIWHAHLAPDTLLVIATPTIVGDPDGVDPATLAPWLTVVADVSGIEHAVLSDGWRHVRLDLEAGTLTGGTPITFEYRVRGIASAMTRILPLRRLLDIVRRRRFAPSLFPHDHRIDRWLVLLRVHDALSDGARQREIACALFGAARVQSEWSGASDSMRSRVRRLVKDARAMAQGGYRHIMQSDRRN